MILKLRKFEYVFPRPALVMGIVNVTPDSFYDGGRYLDPQAAVAHAWELVHAGADLIDIGGESTRPYAPPVGEAEELRRVMPVLERLIEHIKVPVSIDTQKPGVARAALEAGASIVNDVGACRGEPSMAETVATHGAGYVVMHMQGTPQTMQVNPAYDDVLRAVEQFFVSQIARLAGHGVSLEQVILDVGIGFGKTLDHNLELLASIKRFKSLSRPMLLGVSRKSFLGKLLGADVEARLPGALACACWGVLEGAQIIRTHDVTDTVQALRMTEALAARKQEWIGQD